MNPDMLVLGNPLKLWLFLLAMLLVVNIVAMGLKLFVIRRFSDMAQRSETSVDDAMLKIVGGTRLGLVLLVTLYVASRYVELPAQANTALRGAAIIAAFVQVGLWAASLLNFWIDRSQARALRENAAAATGLSALRFIGGTLLWAIVVLLALDNLGVNVTALVAGLGVGGIAIALAVQNILGDLFASLSIVIDKPFVIGDFIVVDDCAGTVEHVGLKTTRLRSLSGEQLVFANSDLLKARLHNYKRMSERRVLFSFGVVYQTGAEQLEGIAATVRSIVEAQPQTRFDRAHLKGFGESSLDYEVVYWMLDPDYNKYMDTQQAINLALIRHFNEAGIGFAFPTRTLFVEGPLQLEPAPAPRQEPSPDAAADKG